MKILPYIRRLFVTKKPLILDKNIIKAKRLAYLIAGYIGGTLTEKEHDELDDWVGACDKNMRLFEELTDERRIKKAMDLLNA